MQRRTFLQTLASLLALPVLPKPQQEEEAIDLLYTDSDDNDPATLAPLADGTAAITYQG